MSARDSAFAYHQSTAFGASAVGQIIALYDTILRDLHRATAAIDAGDIEQRTNSTNHALTVIGELQGVLDFERGGDAARNLSDFYSVTRSMVTEGGVMSSRELLQEVIGMFTRLRTAWSQVERTVTPSEPTRHLRLSTVQQPTPSQNVSGGSKSSETPGSGGWSA